MLQQVIPFLQKKQSESLHRSALRLCFLSGDWIPLAMPQQMHALFKQLRFIALGGATEATVWSNYYEVKEVFSTWNSIPYGKPIQNAKYLVLDKYHKLCPVGVPGDLYIGGQCLAKGYINDEQLSSRKFLPNPYFSGEMYYDTGDMAEIRRLK
jgi:non-ribosomal peptide synthetase component F